MLRKIRIGLALVVFILITLLFLDNSSLLHHTTGWMAKVQFIPAVLALNIIVVVGLLLLTWLFGRIYCSILCPFGILQDIIAWFGKRRKKNRYSYSETHTRVRYIVLSVFILFFILPGTSVIALLIEPYSAFGRIVSSLLSPIYLSLNNLLANWSEQANNLWFQSSDLWLKSVGTTIVALITLIVVGYLAWRNGRIWCNTLCPVGTLLGFVSRHSLFKITIDTSKCNKCSLCAVNCKSECINSIEHHIDYSRCVTCMDCIDKCHKGAISYRICDHSHNKKKHQETVDTSKRQFIAVSTVMMASATIDAKAKKVDGGLAKLEDKEVPQRSVAPKPAGALSVQHFSRCCTACQLCVQACPNSVLRPSSDLTHFMQPEMSFERGYCRPECNQCSQVCPTEAIQPISLEEKSSIQIGHAVVLEKNCLAYSSNTSCGNCANKCPVGAILMVPKDADNPESIKVPVVNESRCIGCGACENLCPVRPFSAIYVEGYETHQELS